MYFSKKNILIICGEGDMDIVNIVSGIDDIIVG